MANPKEPAYLYESYQKALRGGLRDAAETIIMIMASSCPFYREGHCLDVKFCPDCRFYNSEGTRAPHDDLGDMRANPLIDP